MQARAVVIEDAPEFATVARRVLEASGYEVASVNSGEDGLQATRHLAPELVIVDLGLPGMDGLDVCRRIRSFSDAYLVVVTGRDHSDAKVAGFEAGADDYITKPYAPAELAARVSAMRRRPRAVATRATTRAFGPLTVDPGARTVHLAGEEVALTRTEFDILDRLTEQPGVTVSRTQLNQHIWGASPVGSSVLDVHVANLRKKLGEPARQPRWILSVRGIGFRFAPDVAEAVGE